MGTHRLGVGMAAMLVGMGVLGAPAVVWAQAGGVRGGVSSGGHHSHTHAANGVRRGGYGFGGYGPNNGGYGGLYTRTGSGLYTPRIYRGTSGSDPYNNFPLDEDDWDYPPPEVPPGIQGPAVHEVPVSVQVRIPLEDATVWFNGSKTAQTGHVREFVSPPLALGNNYVYEIRARGQGPNGSLDQTRRVTVRAGQRVVVDFATPE